jgi:HD-like signal output (HDOD) protein
MSTLSAARIHTKVNLDLVVSAIDEISTLPNIALSVMQMVDDPNCSITDLKKLMEMDVSLVTRIMRCVNSSAYALTSKMTNLQQAISYLGIKQIRNLVLTAHVNGLFKKNEEIGTYKSTELWRHLVSVGICARLLAMRLKIEYFEDIFLAGLLHDVGIIIEDQYLHKYFSTLIHSLDHNKTLPENEQEQLGIDHTMLGERVGKKWNLPERILAPILYHHSSEHYEGDELQTVRCIEMANIICSLMGITSIGVQLVKFSSSLMAEMSLTKDSLVVLAEDFKKEYEASMNLFQL